jgi:hypothetical protein
MRHPGDDPTVRVVTGEIPVRFVCFLPFCQHDDTFAGNCGDYPPRRAAWLCPGTGRGTLPFE